MILIVSLIFIIIAVIAVFLAGLKTDNNSSNHQPSAPPPEDTGEFSQEELDYWYLNPKDDEI
jgi:hypothetical protein